MTGHSSYFICESDTELEIALHDAPEYPGTAYLFLDIPRGSCHVQASIETLGKIADAINAYLLTVDEREFADRMVAMDETIKRVNS